MHQDEESIKSAEKEEIEDNYGQSEQKNEIEDNYGQSEQKDFIEDNYEHSLQKDEIEDNYGDPSDKSESHKSHPKLNVIEDNESPTGDEIKLFVNVLTPPAVKLW